MVAPERTLLSTLRRESLGMVGHAECTEEKSDEGGGKILFRGFGDFGGGGGCGGFGEFDAPDVFFRLQAENADLIGFGGADLPDPDDTETGFAPAAADFDGLAGAGQESRCRPNARLPG